MKRSLLILSLSALSAPIPLLAGPEIEPFRAIAIQDGGRTKPLDSFARDLARRVQGARPFGLDRIEGLEPSEWLLSLLAKPDEWKDRPIIKVTHAGLREAAALPPGRDRFSLQELLAYEGLRRAISAVQAKSERDEDLDPVDREVSDLYGTLSTLSGVMSGEALRIVPQPDDPKATWLSLADLTSAPGPQVQRVRTLLTALVLAYRDGDRSGVRSAGAALARRLAESARTVYPSARNLGIEVHYNSLKPYRLAWLLYLAGFLVLLSSFPLASRGFGRAGMALVVAAFLTTAYGMALRVLISGRPPRCASSRPAPPRSRPRRF
jgi:hypothetical protein